MSVRPRFLDLAAAVALSVSTAAPVCLAANGAGAASLEASASGGRTSSKAPLSDYERDVLNRVLSERQVDIEPRPDGKTIEGIDVEPLDVFEPADPLPGWLNSFHVTSRTAVIEREILVRPTQPYDQRLVDESARNLRGLRQLSLVLIVPVRSPDRDRVRLLVITKDVWSLRLNSSFSLRNDVVEYLALQPSEENFAGSHVSIAGQYVYDLSTNTFGATASHQRIHGSRIQSSLRINAIQFRETGKFEGSSGSFVFRQPLYSTRSRWAWGTSLSWINRTYRLLLPSRSGAYLPRMYRDPDHPSAPAIPYQYHGRILSWQTAVARSYGYDHKYDIAVGLEALQRRFDANGLITQGYPAEAVRRFEANALERENVRIGPFAQLDSYRNQYVSLVDLETLGLQEDVQLGSRAFIKLYSGTKRAFGTRDLAGIAVGLQYTASSAGSLMRLWTTHTSELTPRHADNDGLVQGGLRLASPPLGIGRFVFDAGALYHYQSSRNQRFALGGDSRLRGYPTDQFIGRHLVASNLEFRSRSVKVFEVLLGLVGFYDVGDAFDRIAGLHPKHTIGIGGRATIPQLQRVVGRLELAFPLTPPVSTAGEHWDAVTVFLTLAGQAFPLSQVQPSGNRSLLLPASD